MSTVLETPANEPVPVPLKNSGPKTLPWAPWQRVLFRFTFVFIGLLIVPLSASWYERLFKLKTTADFFGLVTSYRSDFYQLTSESGKWGVGAFSAWGMAALGGLVGAAIWTWFARKSPRQDYRTLHYWLRLVVRYRIALGLLAFGYMKFYPTQMPYPSYANLETNLGDYTAYKLYWQAVGVVTWYQVVIGCVEVGAAILFLFRGTTALGAAIVIGVLTNIAHANLAYDGGVHVYSAFFALLSVFLLVPYVPDLWRLLVRRQDVTPRENAPQYATNAGRWAHFRVKVALILFFTIGYGYERYVNYYETGLRKEPLTPAPAGLAGVYDVTEFKLNDRVLPYSPDDPVRWQEATFERYVTFAFKVNQALPVHLSNGAPALRDSEKRYELAGVAGGWRYWHYTVNEKAGKLTLQDKNNDADALVGRRRQRLADGTQPEENVKRLAWTYARPAADRVVLDGKDEAGNVLHVVLDRRKSDYALEKTHGELSGRFTTAVAKR